MALDALLATPDTTWLASGKEVRHHFASSRASAGDTVPTYGGPRSYGADALFADTLRIGLDPAGRTVLLCVLVPSSRQDFRTCLARLAPLLSGIPAWTLRLVFPRALAQAYEDYQRVVREEWETPLHPRTIDRLNWYFDQRRKLPQGHSPSPADARYEDAALAFDGPRFDRLYQCWLRNGAASLNDATTRVIGEALTSGSGRVECLILNHSYEHLSPVIVTRGCVVAAAANDLENLTTPRSPNLGSIV